MHRQSRRVDLGDAGGAKRAVDPIRQDVAAVGLELELLRGDGERFCSIHRLDGVAELPEVAAPLLRHEVRACGEELPDLDICAAKIRAKAV